MSDTAKLNLPYLIASQAQKEVTHNEALNMLDTLVQPTIIDIVADPPLAPGNGDSYIVGGGVATGAWETYETYLAAYYDGWIMIGPPKHGWQVYNQADSTIYEFDGTGWVQQTADPPDFSPGAWQIPSLLLDWIGMGGEYVNPRYRIDKSGLVTIEGAMQSVDPAVDGVVFTLLPGFRPSGRLIFPAYSAGGPCRVDVHANGDVEVSGGNQFFTTFSGIQFYATS